MYKAARNKAGLSAEAASFRLHIGRRTLINYEGGSSTIPPEVVLKMAEEYEQPSLCAKHCSKNCPIGQKFAQDVEEKELEVAVLRLLKNHTDVRLIRDRLTEIAEDGIIDSEEMPDFENIMEELLGLERSIMAMKLLAAKVLPLDKMIQREKEKTSKRANRMEAVKKC